MGRVLKRSEHQRIQPADFKRFSERPVNYFRDIVWEPPKAVRPALPVAQADAAHERAIDRSKIASELEAARQQGIQEGRLLGRQDAQQELMSAFQLLEQYAQTLSAERAELASRFESQLVSLATQMAEKILFSELSIKPELLYNIVRAALKEISAARHVTIRVNPLDISHIRSHLGSLGESMSSAAVLEVRPDESLNRGDCLIDSDIGSLDARLATQLNALREQLETAMEKSS